MIMLVPCALDIKDECDKQVAILGIIKLRVKLGSRSDCAKFKVVQKFGTDVMLGFDLPHKRIYAIRLRKCFASLEDGTSVPIRGHMLSESY